MCRQARCRCFAGPAWLSRLKYWTCWQRSRRASPESHALCLVRPACWPDAASPLKIHDLGQYSSFSPSSPLSWTGGASTQGWPSEIALCSIQVSATAKARLLQASLSDACIFMAYELSEVVTARSSTVDVIETASTLGKTGGNK